MQLGDALIDKSLSELTFRRCRELHVSHAIHQIGRLARSLIKGFPMKRMPCKYIGIIFLSTCMTNNKRDSTQRDGKLLAGHIGVLNLGGKCVKRAVGSLWWPKISFGATLLGSQQEVYASWSDSSNDPSIPAALLFSDCRRTEVANISDQPLKKLTILNPKIYFPHFKNWSTSAIGGHRGTTEGSAKAHALLLLEFLRQHPGHAAAHRLLGIAYSGSGDLDAAEAEFRQAVELDRDSAEYWRDYALCLRRSCMQPGKLAGPIALATTRAQASLASLTADGRNTLHACL